MDEKRLEEGLKNRREVLGEARVARVYDGADDFNRPFQELMTEYCWGAVWGREGLSRRDRSLLNLAMLVALNRRDEFRLHVEGAFKNGVTRDEIQEVLLQTMIYCGVPAAVSAFKDASEVFARMEGEKAD